LAQAIDDRWWEFPRLQEGLSQHDVIERRWHTPIISFSDGRRFKARRRL
jgi:hypothetical protein